MKIHVYTCGTAPAHRRHLALIETVEDVPKSKERPAHTRQVFLPVSCWGASQDEAIQEANDFWAGNLDNETRQKERAKAAADRAKARAREERQ